MAGEADASSGFTESLHSTTFMSEEEMYELNQPDGVVPDPVGGDTQTTIFIDEVAPASLAGRSATRLMKEMSKMDAVVPERGGPSTRTGTNAREGDELGAESRRLSEEGWRQTATTNIDASETDCGKRCVQCLRRVILTVSAAYSRVMRPPEEEPLLSERQRTEIAAARINFFERTACTGNRVVEDAGGVSEDSRTLGQEGEERVTQGLARSLAEKMQAEGNTLESLEQKAKMASTLIYPRDFHYLSDEDRNERAITQLKRKEEEVLARKSTLLQTAASEPGLLDFEVEVPPTGRSDITAMWYRINYSTPIEPDDGASAENVESSSPRSPREPADEEATLARLIYSPARPGGLANTSHLELAQNLEVALAGLAMSPPMQGRGVVQAMETMQISSSNTGVGGQEEQVQEQINERSSSRVRRLRSPERYRPYPSRLPCPLSPDRMRRERYYSIHPYSSLSRDPTDIASCSSSQEISPGRRSLDTDGYYRPRRNVRRLRGRRANEEFLDYCSSKEKVLESE